MSLCRWRWLCVLVLFAGCGSPRVTIPTDRDGFIPWRDARGLILSGRVSSVAQNHGRVVWLTLKDGTTYKSREDRLDEVIHLIEEHGLGDEITISTE